MTDCSITTDRRGQRFYRFSAEGKPNRIDSWLKKEDVLRWASNRLAEFSNLSIGEKRFNIGALKLETNSFPMHLPHYVKANVLMSYASTSLADQIEKDIRQKLGGHHPFRCEFTRLVERPPLKHRKQNHQFMKELKEVAQQWDIKLCEHSSAWPSVAGLVPASVPVVCGLGPYSRELYTPKEAVNRLSLVQRCLLLAGFIAEKG
jgi:D-alanine-D-alanine ligase